VTGDPNELTAPGTGLYERLIADLAAAGARYRLIDHQPEGRTELVSALRGHDVAHAAKCLVVMVKVGKKQTRYALLAAPELFFNAARLDRSIALATEDYTRLAAPRIARITAAASAPGVSGPASGR
jgi:Ala-tRNA(Pro) deacylase